VASRFTYSRWDGTQTGFSMDAEDVLSAVSDDLMRHGNIDQALRALMREGMEDRDGRRVEGLREMLERLRQRRRELEESGNLDGIWSEIADALADIVAEERLGIDNEAAAAENSGDERRAAAAREKAAERHLGLDLLPDDLPGQVKSLQAHDFASPEAERRFEELMEKLRQQAMQQFVDAMSEGMKAAGPEDLARMKEMLAALNEMIDRRERGEDPGFEEFMEEFGDFFPDRPRDLDELLAQMAARQQAMRSLMASMSPEQRAQLEELSRQMLGDMDLEWQAGRLAERLDSMFPGGAMPADFRGEMPLDMGEAMDALAEMRELSQLEGMLRSADTPAQLAEIDPEQVRRRLGEEAARSLETLAEASRLLEESGHVRRREGKLELTPKGLRAVGNASLRELFSRLDKDRFGQHRIPREGTGHERNYETKPWEHGDPFRLDLHRTVHNAVARSGAGTPVRLSPEDFEIERTEHVTRSSTVLMIDLSLSMELRGNFVPAKKVAVALHSLISSRFPRDYLGLVGFSETAFPITPEELPESSWDYVQGTNMQQALMLARRMLSRQSGSKQIIMITDGEPTAHMTPSGRVYFNYPPARETLELTLAEVMRCTKDDIRINTFVLDATPALRRFIEQMTGINRGRAFFTTKEELGSFVLVDFLEHRRRTSRTR